MKPPREIDILFDEFVQELPSDYQPLAYEFRAFTRARKVRSVAQLLPLVLLYCGLDLSLRSCAGQVAQLQGYLSDTAVKKDCRRVCRGSRRC
jgi:hypothetical protein